LSRAWSPEQDTSGPDAHYLSAPYACDTFGRGAHFADTQPETDPVGRLVRAASRSITESRSYDILRSNSPRGVRARSQSLPRNPALDQPDPGHVSSQRWSGASARRHRRGRHVEPEEAEPHIEQAPAALRVGGGHHVFVLARSAARSARWACFTVRVKRRISAARALSTVRVCSTCSSSSVRRPLADAACPGRRTPCLAPQLAPRAPVRCAADAVPARRHAAAVRRRPHRICSDDRPPPLAVARVVDKRPDVVVNGNLSALLRAPSTACDFAPARVDASRRRRQASGSAAAARQPTPSSPICGGPCPAPGPRAVARPPGHVSPLR